MPARAITHELYTQAVDYYREHPGDTTGCAKHCGVHYRTALRWWKGPGSKLWSWASEPIRDRLARESVERERKLAEEDERKRVDFAREAERARKLEEDASKFEDQAIQVARADVLHGLAALGSLTKGVMVLARRINEQLERGTDAEGRPLDLNVHACLRVLKDFSQATRGLTDAADMLIKLARVQRDLPATIVGLELAGMTVEDAEREVELATRSVARAKELGLSLVEGGK